MATYRIRPLHVGTFPKFEKSMFLYGVEPGTKIPAPCISWLIEGEKGERILVDTGPHDSDAPTARYHSVIERSDGQRIDQALLAEGVDPKEIQMVIFTHLHWDHCHNPALLENATFYVNRPELAYAIDPIEWNNGAYEAKIPGIKPPWFAIYDRLRTVDDGVELLPGLLFVHLPGHSPGSAGVAVNTAKGVCIIPGDTVPLMENWEGNAKQRHIPSAMTTSMIDYYHSLKRIERLADIVLPSHDFRSLDIKW